MQALWREDPCASKKTLLPDMEEALHWMAEHSAQEVIAFREQVISRIESMAAEFHATGACSSWFAECDPDIEAVAKDVNGPLFQALIQAAKHSDESCPELFRKGAPLYGLLERAGIGEPLECELGGQDDLRGDCMRLRSRACVRVYLALALSAGTTCPSLGTSRQMTMRRSSCGSHVRTHSWGGCPCRCQQSTAISQMLECSPGSAWNRASGLSLRAVCAHRYATLWFFCRPDGSTKVRPVDHFSYSAEGGRSRKKRKASSVNGHTAVPEQIVHDHLDDLAEAMRLFLKQNGAPPSLWKLDVDSAFRRVPLAKEHQWAAAVAFKYRGQVSELLCALLRRSLRLFLHLHETYVSTHKSSPFGATSSVHTWERVGAAMAVFARRLLHLPVLRYVDDYFSLDRSSKRHTARFSLHLGYVLQAGVRRARHALHGQVGASSAWFHGSGRAKNGVWPEAGDPWDSGGTWC